MSLRMVKSTIMQLFPLCEGKMTICSSEAGNITRPRAILPIERWQIVMLPSHKGNTCFIIPTKKKQIKKTNNQNKNKTTTKTKIHDFLQSAEKLNTDQHFWSMIAVFVLKTAGSQKMYKMTAWNLQLACASSQSDQSLWLPKDPNKIVLVRKAKSLISLRWITD